jgi:uncharacterized protein DUF4304
MLRDRIAPGLRELGFRGSGQNFSLPSETHWALLGFQRSAWSDSRHLKFTVNATVVRRTSWQKGYEEFSYISEHPSASLGLIGTTAEAIEGYWWTRIGQLMPGGKDHWWDIGANVDLPELADEVVTSIRDFMLPAMRQQMSIDPTGPSSESIDDDARLIADATAVGAVRAEGLRRLSRSDSPDALGILLRSAADDTLQAELAWEAGAAVARVVWRQVPRRDADLAFTPSAKEGFDETIDRLEALGADARRRWVAVWEETDKNARESKDGPMALLVLYKNYRKLEAADRVEIDRLLVETVLSADGNKRFDALALIEEFHITGALPALETLFARLSQSTAVSAPFDLARVQKLTRLLRRRGVD